MSAFTETATAAGVPEPWVVGLVALLKLERVLELAAGELDWEEQRPVARILLDEMRPAVTRADWLAMAEARLVGLVEHWGADGCFRYAVLSDQGHRLAERVEAGELDPVSGLPVVREVPAAPVARKRERRGGRRKRRR